MLTSVDVNIKLSLRVTSASLTVSLEFTVEVVRKVLSISDSSRKHQSSKVRFPPFGFRKGAPAAALEVISFLIICPVRRVFRAGNFFQSKMLSKRSNRMLYATGQKDPKTNHTAAKVIPLVYGHVPYSISKCTV